MRESRETVCEIQEKVSGQWLSRLDGALRYGAQGH